MVKVEEGVLVKVGVDVLIKVEEFGFIEIEVFVFVKVEGLGFIKIEEDIVFDYKIFLLSKMVV